MVSCASHFGRLLPQLRQRSKSCGAPRYYHLRRGQTQYVVDEKSGYIIPVRDSEAISQAVLSLTESLEKNIAMGLYEIEEVRKALNIQLTCDKFLSLYRSLIRDK